ncbi:hypothetical protein MHU86_11295 [Fragilaria crotonensis]|nr:hypothetical protein MHU86_11295 [Fragilaria crotonensis]
MGHSTFTHASTYSSERVGSEEAHFNAYHFALGDTSYGFSRCQNILSLANLRSAMQLRYPTSSTPEGHNYLSLQQKELVEFGYGMTFTKPQHCVALLAPGEGKSECYIIPTIARVLANQSTKTIIHVSPYRFLAEYQFATCSAAFKKLGLDSNMRVFTGQDITSDGVLPEGLYTKERLPSLLFLNLDALNNLFHYFGEVFKSWLDVVDKIVIDEAHTILSETFSKFTKQLGLSNADDMSDVKVILGNHVVGKFPSGFKIKVAVSSLYVNLAARFVQKKMDSGGGLSGPRCAAHVVVAEKKDGRTLFEQLSTTRYKCKFVSSDSTHKEVKETAKHGAMES